MTNSKKLAKNWKELEKLIGDTEAYDLVSEIVELELLIEGECNK